MNTTKEPAADAAAVTTKMAAKIAAKQVAAEQAEAKQKKKAKATKEVAEDAAPAKATKEETPVQIWPGLISDSGPSPSWALPGRLRPHRRNLSGPCGPPGQAFVGRAFRKNA